MNPVVIVGAGLSGLTAALTLHRSGLPVLVLEASGTVGGLVQSVSEHSYHVEAGPHTVPSTSMAFWALARSVGLEPVSASGKTSARFIVRSSRLVPVPHGPLSLLTTPLLSPGAKVFLLSEPLNRSRPPGPDESVADFARRRLGPEVLDTLLGPFVSGIYAGDPETLSLPAVFPLLARWEADGGSVIRGALRSRKSKAKADPQVPQKPRYALWGLPGGLNSLPQAIVQALPPGSVRLKCPVSAVEPYGEGARVSLVSGEVLSATGVVLATPAGVAAQLLSASVPDVVAPLASIPYAGVHVVHLGLPRREVGHPLTGFGALIPRSEGLKTLGVIFSSSLFPDRAPAGYVLLSAFIGGATQPELRDADEAHLTETVYAELKPLLDLKMQRPAWSKVFRWPAAIPQFTLGHLDRVAQAEAALSSTPQLVLAGNYLHGVALNACVESGERAAAALLSTLQQKRPALSTH